MHSTVHQGVTALRLVYTGDFSCDSRRDFLLLMDVKEWISHKCSGVCNLITISLSNLLLHIIQKEKIAPKIAAKFARVNGPLKFQHAELALDGKRKEC